MTASRFHKPYEEARQKHDEALSEARQLLATTGELRRQWKAERPLLEARLGRHLRRLWTDQLGLRPGPSLRKLPRPPWRRIDWRLRRLERKRLGSYRKALRRLARAATASWPARRRRAELSHLEVRLWVTPFRLLLVLAPPLLVVLHWLAPSLLESFFDFLLEVLP